MLAVAIPEEATMNSKIITVFGATGAQGGSLARALLADTCLLYTSDAADE